MDAPRCIDASVNIWHALCQALLTIYRLACSIWQERNRQPWAGMPSGLIAAAQGNTQEMLRSLQADKEAHILGMIATLIACKSQPSRTDFLSVVCHATAAGLKLHAPLHMFKGRTLLALAAQHGCLIGIQLLTEGCHLFTREVGTPTYSRQAWARALACCIE